jgi:hypothetical protein
MYFEDVSSYPILERPPAFWRPKNQKFSLSSFRWIYFLVYLVQIKPDTVDLILSELIRDLSSFPLATTNLSSSSFSSSNLPLGWLDTFGVFVDVSAQRFFIFVILLSFPVWLISYCLIRSTAGYLLALEKFSDYIRPLFLSDPISPTGHLLTILQSYISAIECVVNATNFHHISSLQSEPSSSPFLSSPEPIPGKQHPLDSHLQSLKIVDVLDGNCVILHNILMSIEIPPLGQLSSLSPLSMTLLNLLFAVIKVNPRVCIL